VRHSPNGTSMVTLAAMAIPTFATTICMGSTSFDLAGQSGSPNRTLTGGGICYQRRPLEAISLDLA
jgi:hypothetical protein